MGDLDIILTVKLMQIDIRQELFPWHMQGRTLEAVNSSLPQSTPHLDGVHTVFGHTANMDVVNPRTGRRNNLVGLFLATEKIDLQYRAKYPFESMRT